MRCDGDVTFIGRTITDDIQGDLSVIEMMDVDGDFDLDCIAGATDGTDGSLHWYDNANGVISNVGTAVGDDAVPRAMRIADIDGDGLDDLVVAMTRDGDDRSALVWYRHSSSLSSSFFAPPVSIAPVSLASWDIDVADIENDGDMDIIEIVVTQKLRWHENNGDGTTWAVHDIPVSDRWSVIKAADVDGDGNVDCVLAASRGATHDGMVAWLRNLGGGTFADPVVIADTTTTFYILGVHSLEVVDLDVDGLNDIIAIGDDAVVAYYLNNDDDTTFHQVPLIYERNAQVEAVAIDDLDGDGSLDIAASLSRTGNVLWYSNLVDEAVVDTNVDQPALLIVADIDDDRDIDLILASGSQSTISFYENICIPNPTQQPTPPQPTPQPTSRPTPDPTPTTLPPTTSAPTTTTPTKTPTTTTPTATKDSAPPTALPTPHPTPISTAYPTI